LTGREHPSADDHNRDDFKVATKARFRTRPTCAIAKRVMGHHKLTGSATVVFSAVQLTAAGKICLKI
jgi:hypothetical protein